MTCSQAALLDHCAGRLTGPALAELEQHLETCSACRALATEHKALWSALDEWTDTPIAPDFDRRLLTRLAMEPSPESWARSAARWIHHWWKPMVPALAASAAAVTMVVIQPWSTPPAVPADPAVDAAQVEQALDDIDMLRQLSTQETRQDL